jgi:hypothetical protein
MNEQQRADDILKLLREYQQKLKNWGAAPGERLCAAQLANICNELAQLCSPHPICPAWRTLAAEWEAEATH